MVVLLHLIAVLVQLLISVKVLLLLHLDLVLEQVLVDVFSSKNIGCIRPNGWPFQTETRCLCLSVNGWYTAIQPTAVRWKRMANSHYSRNVVVAVVVVVEVPDTTKYQNIKISNLYPLVQRAAVDVVVLEQQRRGINGYLERSRSPQYRSSRQSRRRVASRTAMMAKSDLDRLNGIVIIV